MSALDGTLYHHLLNPKTGYPYDNGLIAVTIISDQSVDGDALSTTCFALGIQKPFADRSETIAVMDIRDKSVVSSGIYERCFEQDGTLYHHLLNPKTGYPYDNGLIAVTIISDQSVDGDALSTTCFALGLEDGMKLAESLDDVQAFFVTSDYEIHYTRDFQKKIKVTETE